MIAKSKYELKLHELLERHRKKLLSLQFSILGTENSQTLIEQANRESGR